MSDAGEQVQRALEDMERPEDVTAEEGLEVDVHPDRTRTMTHIGLARMRTTWGDDDAARIEIVKAEARRVLREDFKVAYVVMERLHRRVRTPLADPETGEIRAYPDGTPMWETDEDGVPAEDWGAITSLDREQLLWMISTWLYEWELKAVDAWAEAMFSKVAWEEMFARGFVAMPGSQPVSKPTIHDRTQWGQQYSADERYLAVFKSYLSKQADAVVRSMNRILRMLEGTAIR